MTAYYNEFDPYAAEWLKALIQADMIAPGDVDSRSILEVKPSDLEGYAQVHLFAGLGGWSYALRMAGWDDETPVWTGSCPCQPFSAAGKQKGTKDARHLWPEFARLIAECGPATVFGEQVASKAGRSWLAGVQTDVEALGYRFGAADLCAAGVGAPHIRQRLWWVADAGLPESQTGGISTDTHREPQSFWSNRTGRGEPSSCGGVGHADAAGSQGHTGHGEVRNESEWVVQKSHGSHWAVVSYIPCGDGKARRIEPGTQPLAHGVPGRVGRLRAYGNAIVPQVAASFVQAYCEARDA